MGSVLRAPENAQKGCEKSKKKGQEDGLERVSCLGERGVAAREVSGVSVVRGCLPAGPVHIGLEWAKQGFGEVGAKYIGRPVTNAP